MFTISSYEMDKLVPYDVSLLSRNFTLQMERTIIPQETAHFLVTKMPIKIICFFQLFIIMPVVAKWQFIATRYYS